jgi:peptidoglycan/xylan/chitin deacetylase (PgdA/CDA1 family)
MNIFAEYVVPRCLNIRLVTTLCIARAVLTCRRVLYLANIFRFARHYPLRRSKSIVRVELRFQANCLLHPYSAAMRLSMISMVRLAGFSSMVSTSVAAPTDAFRTRLSSELIGSKSRVCGLDYGHKSCSSGWCCGSNGLCGKGSLYCSPPDCQLQYSDACDVYKDPHLRVDTSFTPRPHFGSVKYGTTISSCSVPGLIALTFDDGPSEHTSKLLDILATESIKATFFVIGSTGDADDDQESKNQHLWLVKRMVAEGHQVAQHTWTHKDLDEVSQEQRRQQMLYNEAAIASDIGVFPTYMRAPYLSCGPECLVDLKALGYHVIGSNLDSNDWKMDYNTSKKHLHNALVPSSPSKDSYIPLFHELHHGTMDTLVPYVIKLIRQKGYRAVTVGECLQDPLKNWYRNLRTGEPQLPTASFYSKDWQ